MVNQTPNFKPINSDGFWNRQAAQTGFTGYNDLPEELVKPTVTRTPEGGFEGYC